MVPQWKRWLGAAAVLLLVGAGCEADVGRYAPVDSGTSGESQDEGQAKIEADASASADVDVDDVVDEALKESDADAMIEYEEGSDADVVTDDKAELDAYGKAYDKSQL
ncbi:MAG TPA: hypothetical protein VJ694_00815 [Patescibacteria group bacterium]|nr:hypothetical protein [Patescibacteria group bacterium]